MHPYLISGVKYSNIKGLYNYMHPYLKGGIKYSNIKGL